MKIKSFLLLSFLVLSNVTSAIAVTDPALMYQELEGQIKGIEDSKFQISDALSSVNLSKKERKELVEWQDSLDKEQQVLKDRLELLRKLEKSGILTYITPSNLNDKGASQPINELDVTRGGAHHE